MKRLSIAFLLSGLLVSSMSAAAAPRVVASIKPLHSLSAAVMDGVGEPELLLSAGDSPHTYTMRPSEARAVRGADLVLYVSPHMEAFLEPALELREAREGNLAAAQMEGITLFDGRDSDDWQHSLEGHAGSNGHPTHAGDEPGEGREGHRADKASTSQDSHGEPHSHAHQRDYHLWLDPRNARVIVAVLADKLSEMDPANAQHYRRNADQLDKRLQRLDERIAQELAAVKERPYIVFHDAYQYFERRYGLQSAGAVKLTAQQRPGAGHLRDIRERIKELKVECVFIEPQFEPAAARALTRGLEVSIGELDPIGSGIETGPDAYFQLLERLAAGFKQCLE